MSKRQTAESECDQCHEPILWARNSKTGGSIPLDIRPSLNGQFVLNELTMYCTKLDLSMIERAIEKKRSLFSNHLATCSVRQAEAEDE